MPPGLPLRSATDVEGLQLHIRVRLRLGFSLFAGQHPRAGMTLQLNHLTLAWVRWYSYCPIVDLKLSLARYRHCLRAGIQSKTLEEIYLEVLVSHPDCRGVHPRTEPSSWNQKPRHRIREPNPGRAGLGAPSSLQGKGNLTRAMFVQFSLRYSTPPHLSKVDAYLATSSDVGNSLPLRPRLGPFRLDVRTWSASVVGPHYTTS